MPTLIDLYLDRQQQLTAVERFSHAHESDALPSQEKYYSTLLPAAPPGPGEQYAFEVDLDRCSGCKACVTACHQLNGLDEHETWRDVGLLHGGPPDEPVIQHVTSACHHCLEPACLNVCPVDAYEKDPLTGIVKHLDDQCIGCQYCTLACPYDVPKYHRQKGIVRKCDLCSDRLASGEAPACVQSCPNEAIRVSVVSHESVIESSETNLFLPGAPEPQYTLPTTVYRTRRVLPRNLLPADYYSVRPEHAHWPLVFMLVLTQLSVGAFVVAFALDAPGHAPPGRNAARGLEVVSALFFGLLALGASTCHLGRPLYAFRAVIGLRHSWLSREIVAFGLFAPLAAAYAAAVWLAPPGGALQRALGAAVLLTGLAGVFCSIMIYQCTRRAFWNGADTAFKFLSSMVLLGTAAALATAVLAGLWSPGLSAARGSAAHGELLCRGLIVLAGVKLLFEAAIFRHLRSRQNTLLKRSALLLTGELATATKARFTLGVLGGIALPLALVVSGSFSQPAGAAALAAVAGVFLATLAGELLERYLFFTAVVAPRMPGGLTP